MAKVNDMLPTVSPQTPDEYYAQWVDREGINAEKVRDDSLTAIQRAYDRSSATYGATAEMLRQSGLNNSGLAGLYQNMAETNRRQSVSDVYSQYDKNIRQNKAGFSSHMQGIQSKLYEQALTMPKATKEDLEAIAAMYGVDPITASQMAQISWDSTAGIRERALQDEYRQAESDAQKYISEIASSGGVLDANAIAKMFPTLAPNGDLSSIQNMIGNTMNSHADVYANNAAAKIYQDLVNGTLKVADLDDPAKRAEIAKKYGVPESKIDSAFANARTEYTNYSQEKTTREEQIADMYISSVDVGFEVTNDMVKNFAKKYDISEDVARKYLEKEREETQKFSDIVWRLYENGEYFSKPDDVRYALEEYGYENDLTSEEIRLIYNDYVGRFKKQKEEEEDKAKSDGDKNLSMALENINGITSTSNGIAQNTISKVLSNIPQSSQYYSQISQAISSGDLDTAMDLSYEYAIESGNTELKNSMGNQILSYDISYAKENGNSSDIFKILGGIYDAEYNDGSEDAKRAQYDIVLGENNENVSVKGKTKIEGKGIKRTSVTVSIGDDAKITFKTYNNNKYDDELKKRYPSANEGDIAVTEDDKGRHLNVFYNGKWRWIEKGSGGSGSSYLWEALVETNKSILPKAQPTVNNKNDGIFENFYNTISNESPKTVNEAYDNQKESHQKRKASRK